MITLTKAVEYMKTKGAKPITTAQPAAAAPAAAGPASAICPTHHVKMSRRTKNGESWYSHKAVDAETGAEYYCKGQ